MTYEFRNDLIVLHSLFEYAKHLEGLLLRKPSLKWNERDSLLLFNQTTQSIGVTLAFLPDSPLKSDFKSLSPSTLCSVARNVMDNFFTITYLLDEQPTDIIAFRELVWDQFVDQQRYEMVNLINPDNPDLPKLKERIERRKPSIQTHPVFTTLDRSIANNCAIGQTDKTISKEAILALMRIAPSVFWSTNKHFSQYVHSTAFAADQLASFGNNPQETIRFITTLLRDLTGLYSLSILSVSYGFNVPADIVPLNVLDTLLFWQDFFRDTKEEKYAK